MIDAVLPSTPPFFVVGFSLGGAIVSHFLAKHHERYPVRGAILLGTAGVHDPRKMIELVATSWCRILREGQVS